MGNRSVVPFGPQHPVLPEPIHLDLVLEDEKVLAAIPSIGFIHRGLESLTSKKILMRWYMLRNVYAVFAHSCMAWAIAWQWKIS